MPWELTIVNYDGTPPRLFKDADEARELPMGTLDEVRKYISEVLPGTEWHEEPPLLEMMKASGSELWKDWDQQMIAFASMPKWRAIYQDGGLSFDMFGFEHDGPVKHFLIDVRGSENPIPALQVLCDTTGWSVAEMGKDGEFLDLDGAAGERWNQWRDYLNRAIQQTPAQDDSEA